jgi:hypothetical protein
MPSVSVTLLTLPLRPSILRQETTRRRQEFVKIDFSVVTGFVVRRGGGNRRARAIPVVPEIYARLAAAPFVVDSRFSHCHRNSRRRRLIPNG